MATKNRYLPLRNPHVRRKLFFGESNTLDWCSSIRREMLKILLPTWCSLSDEDIRRRYHPVEGKDGKQTYNPADYTLSSDDNKLLCQWLMELKVPDGYSGNISRCVNATESKFTGMKTHDCHVFLERLLPFVAEELLPKDICEPLVELSYFFKGLCAKVLREEDLDLLQDQIGITLCKLEKIFPPAFFDIMIHLTCHLAWEAKMAGPVQFRWMYPVERYLHKLKSYVRNKARPEGSIAEAYLADECITFCSRYLHRVETKFNQTERNFDGGEPSNDTPRLSIFSTRGQTFGKGVHKEMSKELHKAATHYVLQNCDEAMPFVEEHKNILIQSGVNNVEESHMLQFTDWFYNKINQLYSEGKISKQLLSLAQGPERRATYYPGYNMSGFRFHTMHRDETKRTQNSGVMVKRDDQNDHVPWYGTLVEIVELRYTEGNKVVLFNCDWYDTYHKKMGYKINRYGIISVNARQKIKTKVPFVLACQAIQCFYLRQIKDKTWTYVVETDPRNTYAQKEEETNDESEPYQEEETHLPKKKRRLDS